MRTFEDYYKENRRAGMPAKRAYENAMKGFGSQRYAHGRKPLIFRLPNGQYGVTPDHPLIRDFWESDTGYYIDTMYDCTYKPAVALIGRGGKGLWLVGYHDECAKVFVGDVIRDDSETWDSTWPPYRRTAVSITEHAAESAREDSAIQQAAIYWEDARRMILELVCELRHGGNSPRATEALRNELARHVNDARMILSGEHPEEPFYPEDERMTEALRMYGYKGTYRAAMDLLDMAENYTDETED